MPWVKNFLRIYWSWNEDLFDKQLIQIKNVLQDTSFLIAYKNQYVPQGNQWWPVKPKDLAIPLSDRVENSILDLLQKKQKVSLIELDQEICAEFCGICIPPLELIQICLESYAEPLPDQEGNFSPALAG